MLPRFVVLAELAVFATLQLTGTMAPVEAVAVHVRVLPEATTVAAFPEASSQMTAEIAVAGVSVTLSVAFRLPSTCEVAVIVMTLLVGTVAGAVYNPPLLIDPFPDPVTVQFTKVLLRLATVATHWEVPSTVTSVGSQETLIVGVAVVELGAGEFRPARGAAGAGVMS